MTPTFPIKVYKHAEQFLYKKGKPGLDKNTELSERLRLTGNLKFEVKYLLRLFDALLINTWRCIQAHNVVSTFSRRGIGELPNIAALRRQFRDMTIYDFAFDFALKYLKELRIRSSEAPINNDI